MERQGFTTVRKKLPKYVSVEEISSTLDKAKNEGKKHSYRNFIILMTLSRTGIRANEIVDLRKQNIKQDTLIVRQGKGKKDRVIPLEKELSQLLGLYTDQLKPRDRVFSLSDRQVRNIVYKYSPFHFEEYKGKKVKRYDMHPHTLRHSFAVHCLKSGMNIRSLQKILGHTNLNTTQVYLDVVGADLKQDFEKVVW